jgi:mannose-1-phosphate guanylyltransferase
MAIIPVILSGGGGTRLWPLSTPARPKQFLALTAEATMFELTVERVRDPAMFTAPMIVTGAAHAKVAEEQLDAMGIHDATLILEPCARNTGPAIALAALAASDPTAVMLVMPSDHVIADPAAFHTSTQAALLLVENGWMATYGIAPTGPETGYGYIRMGEQVGPGVNRVERFVEKPDAERAAAMLAEGNHSWNGGIFLFRADIYLGALAVHAPEMLAAAQKAMTSVSHHGRRILPDAEAFAACPADSIDYAVMEKAERVAVVPVNMGWSDVGSWDALFDLANRDANNNAYRGIVRSDAATGNLIHADGVRVSIHGVKDVIVVANGSEVMILPRGSSQKVRDFAKD